MSEEERRKKAAQRTKAWKERNGWLVKHQRKRRWARVKEALAITREVQARVTRVTNGLNKGTEGMPHYGDDLTYETDEEGYEREANKNGRPTGDVTSTVPNQKGGYDGGGAETQATGGAHQGVDSDPQRIGDLGDGSRDEDGATAQQGPRVGGDKEERGVCFQELKGGIEVEMP